MCPVRAPVPSLRTPTGSRKYLDTAEREQFLATVATLPLRLRTLCLVLAWTGCRLSEALALQTDACDGHEGVIAIRSLKKRSKSVVVREVPVPDHVLADVLAHCAACQLAPDQRLWTWGRCRAWQLVKMVMVTAGIRFGPQRTPKGLRHAFGVHAIRCNVPITLVQRWLGHASLSTTAIYLQATGREEREIAARMWT